MAILTAGCKPFIYIVGGRTNESDDDIDITHIPFSRYGAYLAVTRDEGKDGTGDAKELVIQCARRRFEESPLFSLTFGGEAPEDFSCSAVPELLTVGNENGKLQK